MIVVIDTPESEPPAKRTPTYANLLLGVWSLVSYADEQSGREDTLPFGPDPQGFLIYTPDGFVSAQLMRPDRPAFDSSDLHHGTPQEYEASGSGYIAYCGTHTGSEGASRTQFRPSSSWRLLLQDRQISTGASQAKL